MTVLLQLIVLASGARIPDNPGSIIWRIVGIYVVSHGPAERGPGTPRPALSARASVPAQLVGCGPGHIQPRSA